MSPFAILLLVAALVLLAAAEWSHVAKLGVPRVAPPRRRRKKPRLRVVDDHDDFARSVERDLASLPTIDEHDLKKR